MATKLGLFREGLNPFHNPSQFLRWNVCNSQLLCRLGTQRMCSQEGTTVAIAYPFGGNRSYIIPSQSLLIRVIRASTMRELETPTLTPDENLKLRFTEHGLANRVSHRLWWRTYRWRTYQREDVPPWRQGMLPSSNG